MEEVHKLVDTLSAMARPPCCRILKPGGNRGGDVLRCIAENGKYGVPTPVNDTLFRMIRTLEQMKLLFIDNESLNNYRYDYSIRRFL